LKKIRFSDFQPYSYDVHRFNPGRYFEFYSCDRLKYAVYFDETKESFRASVHDGKSKVISDIFEISSHDLKTLTLFMSDSILNKSDMMESADISNHGMSPDYFREINGQKADDVIKKGKLVKVMLLNPFEKDVKSDCKGFPIISEVDSVGLRSLKSFSKLLLRNDCYMKGGLIKNASFLPDYACMYQLGDDVVYVLVALYCDDIRVYFSNDYKTMDIGPTHAEFAQFARMSFPDDKYLTRY